MSWAVGWSSRWQRDIGYGVPALCDWPDCGREIDRGMGYACGRGESFDDRSCGLFFCGEHEMAAMPGHERSEFDCSHGDQIPKTPDTDEWVQHKLHDPSWAKWREQMGWTA